MEVDRDFLQSNRELNKEVTWIYSVYINIDTFQCLVLCLTEFSQITAE